MQFWWHELKTESEIGIAGDVELLAPTTPRLVDRMGDLWR